MTSTSSSSYGLAFDTYRKISMTKQKEASAQSFFVSGVCCAMEEAIVRKHLDAVAGPESYSFNPVTSELRLHEGAKSGQVVKKLTDAGFATRSKQELELPVTIWERHREGIVTGIASLFTVTGVALDHMGLSAVAVHGLLLAAIIIGGWKVAARAWKSIRTYAFDMNVLMTVAVCGALFIGKWTEGAAVVVLYAASLMLESYSAARTRRAIQSLINRSPQQARVIQNSREETIDARDIVPGQRVIIRPGENIPVDGLVVEGRSFVDQSAITGEATPISRCPGEHVYAGSINRNGALQVEAVSKYEDSTLAKMVHLVEQAQLKRAPIQHTVDKFARVYTPVVLIIAMSVAVVPPVLMQLPFGEWVYRALVLLVIACPCALVISTPVTLVSALTRAARLGILIKGGRQLEMLAAVRTVAFDKTGTLTFGKPRVTDIILMNSLSRSDALRIAAALEHRSEHPVAFAITQEAVRSTVEYHHVSVEGFEAIPGRGVRGTIGGIEYFLGNHQLCEERGSCSPEVERVLEQLEYEEKTTILLGKSGEVICILAVQDAVRGQSASAVQSLKNLGVKQLWLLSGDQAASAQQLAGEVGIDEYRTALLPHQKIEIVEQLKTRYGTIAMVGDGINDAPALAAASVGIAMGVTGTDAALETADVILMGDDLSKLPLLIQLSRKTMAIIKQNIAVALSLKALFLVLTVAGVGTLWMAVLADDGAALIVILNGLRALSFEKDL